MECIFTQKKVHLTLIGADIWSVLFSGEGGEYNSLFIFQEEIIQYQYNFAQLLNKQPIYHLLHIDVIIIIIFFVTRKCQKSQKANEKIKEGNLHIL